jgi:hypothetical protein
MNTMKFALRAKKVKQEAVINEVVDQSTMIKQYQDEIMKLKEQLIMAQAVALEHQQQQQQQQQQAAVRLAMGTGTSSSSSSATTTGTSPLKFVNGREGAHPNDDNAENNVALLNQSADNNNADNNLLRLERRRSRYVAGVSDDNDDDIVGAEELMNAIQQLENLILSSQSGSVISAIKTATKKQIHAQKLRNVPESPEKDYYMQSQFTSNPNAIVMGG